MLCFCCSAMEYRCDWAKRGALTAKEPGAFRAAVHPQPRYRPKPSSATILRTPRPRKASGLVWRLILRTSRGSRTISPIPIRLSQVNTDFSILQRKSVVFSLINSPASSRVHNSLARLLAKSGLKILSIVLAQEVARNGLPAILVYSLEHLVAGGVAQTGE